MSSRACRGTAPHPQERRERSSITGKPSTRRLPSAFHRTSSARTPRSQSRTAIAQTIPPPARMNVKRYGPNGDPLSPDNEAFAATICADANAGATQNAATHASVAIAERLFRIGIMRPCSLTATGSNGDAAVLRLRQKPVASEILATWPSTIVNHASALSGLYRRPLGAGIGISRKYESCGGRPRT